MSNTGRTVSDVKSPGEIKVSLLSMRYHSFDQNTIDVCTEAVRLIIDQQLRLASFEKELITAEKRIAELEKELNDTKYLLSISSNMIRALNATE
jgi:septal ring factor EnvC (AmiA/AmiB activator)